MPSPVTTTRPTDRFKRRKNARTKSVFPGRCGLAGFRKGLSGGRLAGGRQTGVLAWNPRRYSLCRRQRDPVRLHGRSPSRKPPGGDAQKAQSACRGFPGNEAPHRFFSPEATAAESEGSLAFPSMRPWRRRKDYKHVPPQDWRMFPEKGTNSGFPAIGPPSLLCQNRRG